MSRHRNAQLHNQSPANISFSPSQASWSMLNFVQRPNSFFSLSFLYSALALLVGAFTYSYFAKVPVSVAASGVLATKDDSMTTSQAELLVTARDVAKVGNGMKVILKIRAFPTSEFGTVAGKVTDVSPNPAPSSGTEAGTSYKVSVLLTASSFSQNGRAYPFQPGMAVDGVIIVEQEKILKLALRKIFNLKDTVSGKS
ncbi:MAG: HlyD family efflux transporter periplasmic adaptor subunit [Deltaproteobacteria bacterium]|nr:HlyD family efflux transporter periplasmic adaptor subunit [Deltaproteobacteria bacterium]MBI3293214.1 HlyD family efflux transporter periplasmic adaptor subunit [Deltaproteobacteria bacterium]